MSNNTASRNTLDGINAVGNINGGGNTARKRILQSTSRLFLAASLVQTSWLRIGSCQGGAAQNLYSHRLIRVEN